jgi:hypothetical protein
MLTDTKARNAKAADKPYNSNTDSGGLHLYATPAGSRIWRARYKFDGKENVLTIGHYPEVSLAQARAARDEAATVRHTGRDPAVRKETKAAVVVAAANTFEVMARAWHAQPSSGGKNNTPLTSCAAWSAIYSRCSGMSRYMKSTPPWC